jgi:formylglycine-generating enzyme required for sulfatase activity
MHRAERRDDLGEAELRKLLERPLRGIERHRERKLNVSSVIDWFRRTTGVLTEYATVPVEYGFLHLGLQEYLAARYAATYPAEGIEMLATHFGSSWWREVVLLFVALPEYRHFDPLMERVLAQGKLVPEREHVYECLLQAHVRDLRPFFKLIADRGAPIVPRLEALRLVQDQEDEELIELASAVALEPGANAGDLRRVAEQVEANAPRIEEEREAEPPADVLLVCTDDDEAIAQGMAKVMQRWGWRTESTTELASRDTPWTRARSVVVVTGLGAHNPWQTVASRQCLVQMVRRGVPIVVALWPGMTGDMLPAFLQGSQRAELRSSDLLQSRIPALVAETLGVAVPEAARTLSLTVNVAAEGGRVLVGEQTGMRLTWVPGGRFTMGSPDTDDMAYDDEMPAHEVGVSGFWLGETAVTNRQYRMALAAGMKEPMYWRDRRFNQPEQPVVGISWHDALRFCNALSEQAGLTPCYRFVESVTHFNVDWVDTDGYRLPTEAEWEYACRAGTQTRWSCGDDETSLDEYAWYVANSKGMLHPVGRKKPNPWGLYDMHGNVYEWCWGWFDSYMLISSAYPKEPLASDRCVLRGGSFENKARHARSANRLGCWPDRLIRDQGLRVARSATPESLDRTHQLHIQR